MMQQLTQMSNDATTKVRNLFVYERLISRVLKDLKTWYYSLYSLKWATRTQMKASNTHHNQRQKKKVT
jgi:hypothetical protein